MGKVVSINVERWIKNVFSEGNVSVDVSTRGRVRFKIQNEEKLCDATLTMEQMARLGESLSIAFKEDEDG